MSDTPLSMKSTLAPGEEDSAGAEVDFDETLAPGDPADSGVLSSAPSETPAPDASSQNSATNESDDPLIGRQLSGRYHIHGVLGRGGMGAVYEAEHVLMKKTVAVKVLHSELTSNKEVLARFRREAQAAANIDHPNVCTATDFGQMEDGAFFLVMEHLEGATLEKLLKDRGRLDVELALHIAEQVCSALHQAHELGVVHRDLKPENVMLIQRDTEPFFVKMMDFGVASVYMANEESEDAHHTRLTRAGIAYGTPAYMSPEQVVGAENIDSRADLYTLGVMLFEMLTGTLPFEGPSIPRLMSQHLTQPPPLLSERSPDLRFPPGLEQVIASLLAKEPEGRIQSARLLRERLVQVRQGHPDDAAGLPSVSLTSGLERVGDSFEMVTGKLARVPDRFHELDQESRLLVVAAPVVALVLLLLMTLIVVAVTRLRDPEEVSEEVREQAAVERIEETKKLSEERDEFTQKAEVSKILTLMAQNEYEKSIEELDALAPDHEKNPHFHYYKGVALAGKEDWPEALSSYRRALALDARYVGDDKIREDTLENLSSRSDDRAEEAKKIAVQYLALPLQEEFFDMAVNHKRSRNRKAALSVLEESGELEKMPKWKQLTIELRHSSGCKEHEAVINKMIEFKDPRVLPILRDMKKAPRRGCGPLNLSDCYGCIRKELRESIKTLEKLEGEKGSSKSE